MFKFTRQHSSVELVELHQLNQVGEFGGAVIKAEEDLAVLFTLSMSMVPGESKQGKKKEKRKCDSDVTITIVLHVCQQQITL